MNIPISVDLDGIQISFFHSSSNKAVSHSGESTHLHMAGTLNTRQARRHPNTTPTTTRITRTHRTSRHQPLWQRLHNGRLKQSCYSRSRETRVLTLENTATLTPAQTDIPDQPRRVDHASHGLTLALGFNSSLRATGEALNQRPLYVTCTSILYA